MPCWSDPLAESASDFHRFGLWRKIQECEYDNDECLFDFTKCFSRAVKGEEVGVIELHSGETAAGVALDTLSESPYLCNLIISQSCYSSA